MLSLDALRALLPMDSRHPVLHALSKACLRKFAEGLELLENATRNVAVPSKSDFPEIGAKIIQTFREWNELLDWIYPATSALSLEKGMSIANLMDESGFPSEEIDTIVKRIGRRPPGRPATKRRIAVQAKEMRLTDSKRWKWQEITRALCDCGKEHTIRCQDNLRREVLHLEKTLQKFGCSV